METKTGTAGDDTFSGLFGTSNTADTLNTADVLDGGAGNDVLNLIATGTAASGIATISNIETINIKDVVGSTFNATIVTGAKNINFTDTISGKTSKVDGLTDLNTVVGIAGEGDLTVSYNAGAVGGTDDTAKVAIDGIGNKSGSTVTRGTIDVSNSNAIENVALDVKGDNYIKLTGGTAMKKVTVTGAGSLDITGTALVGDGTNSNLTFDASAATGKQNILFGAGNITVKGGSADDTFAFGTTLGSTDSIDGGAGNDKVTFTFGTAVQTIPTIANVETIEATYNAAAVLNASKITGATTMNFKGGSGTNAVTVTNLAQGASTLNFNDNTTAAGASIGYATNAQSDVTVNVGHINTATNGTGSNITLGGLIISGNKGTVTINSIVDTDNTSAVTNNVGNLNIGSATKLTLNSASKANLTVGTMTAGSATEINIAANSGMVNVGALDTADKLTKLNITSTNDGSVTTGAIGSTAAASALTDVVINIAGKTGTTAATVNLVDITATKNGSSGAGSSALKNVDITLGAGLIISALPGISGVDSGNSGTTDGAGVAQLDSYKLTVGAGTAVVAHPTANLGARSVTAIDISAAEATSAYTVAQKFAIDESLNTMTLTAGKNATVSVELDGINDAEVPELYDLTVGTITASGEGNVAIKGLSTVGAKSIGTIDFSAVKGTSALVASTLSGTTGINILIGEGGTGTGGVNGSNKADVITGGKGADLINGGDGADQITGGLGADIITGGAGQDTIDLTEATQSIDTIRYAESGAANVDTVTGFKVGTDVVSFSTGNIAEPGVGNVTLSTGNGTDISAAVATGAAVFTAVAKNAAVANDATTTLLKLSALDATTFATAIGTGSYAITADADFTATTEGLAAVFYDSLNGQAVFGYVRNTSTTTANVLNADDTFVEITRVGMTSTDFTALDNTSFSMF